MALKLAPGAAHCSTLGSPSAWDRPLSAPPSTGRPGSHLLSAWPHPLPDSSRQPPNILMVHPAREDIKICDFGFAQKITPAEPQYSKYGCPEFVSPEIIQQTPVSKASDIW